MDFPRIAPFPASPVTRNSEGLNRREQRIKQPRTPKASPPAGASHKPPRIEGYFWRKDGAGWELRKSVYLYNPATGNNERKQPYIAHLSREKFQEMKRAHKGKAIHSALQKWIDEREAEKGIDQ